MRDLNGAMVDYLVELLLARERDFSIPAPFLAARLGAIAAVETAMEVIVERRLLPVDSYPFTDEQLIEELAQLLGAYFTKS